jgi:hypothetical protein
MTAHRATILAASAAALLAAAPAAAQVDDGIVLNIMRECAKIDDPTARLACYDNNIRTAGPAARVTVPGRMQPPQGGSAPVSGNSVQRFGAEDIRTPDRFETPAGEVDEIQARVRSIREREPGVYQLTLEDGAQWRFAEGVSFAFRVPREGASISIERGALGSFLLRYDSQEPVPVIRIR